MNLVFNTFVTDESINEIHGENSPWQQLRRMDTTYRKRSKLDIFKYTLDSYTHINFKDTFFWVQCADPSKHDEINAYIFERWPNAYVNNKRCLTYPEYQEMLALVPKDDWVFFSPNNDHVFWSPYSVDPLLKRVISMAESDICPTFNNMVGVFYSHFEEFVNLAYRDTWMGQRYNNDREPRNTFADNDTYVAFSSLLGENTSIQILHPDLFRAFFSTYQFGDKPIRRLEDLRPHFCITNQVSVVPKYLICAHFDGQPSLNPFIIPPLFIPEGYFSGRIPTAINKKFYEKDKLNISSRAKLYSYMDQRMGTDFIGTVEDLPLFLKERLA